MPPLLDLPTAAEALAEATWDDIRPFYEALAQAPLSADAIEPWLAEWSALDALVKVTAYGGCGRRVLAGCRLRAGRLARKHES